MPVLDVTATLGLPKPHPDNDPFVVDVVRIRTSLDMIDAAFATDRATVAALPTDSEVDNKIAAEIARVVGAAPAALDSLYEIAAKLGSNDDAVAAIVATLGTKAVAADVNAAFAGIYTRLNTIEADYMRKAGGTFTGPVTLVSSQISTLADAFLATTGKFVQADVLAAYLDQIMPVGSYRMQYFATPIGTKWLPADGRKVSLASYPKLATAMPATSYQFLDALAVRTSGYYTFNQGYTYSPPITGTYVTGCVDGTRGYALTTTGFFVMDLATGNQLGGGGMSVGARYANQVQCVVKDTNQIFWLNNAANGLRYAGLPLSADNTSSTSGTNAGIGNLALGGYEQFYKLPNKTILFFGQIGTAPAHNCWRNRLAEGGTTWTTFNPGGSTFQPPRHWQTKDGTVYVACRPTTGNWIVYRTTDGETWNVCTTLTGTSGINLAMTTLLADPFPRASMKRPAAQQQSPDGTQIVIQAGNGQGWLVSLDSGATWKLVTAATILAVLGGVSSPSVSTGFGFRYDTFRNRWVVGNAFKRTATGDFFIVAMFTTTDWTTFTKIAESTYNGNYASNNAADAIVLCRSGKLALGVKTSGGNYLGMLCGPSGEAPIQDPYTYSEFAIFDHPEGDILINGALGNGVSVRWVGEELNALLPGGRVAKNIITRIGTIDNYHSDARDWTVSADWVFGATEYTQSSAYGFIYGGKRFTYNPATERVLPTVTAPLLGLQNSGGFGANGIAETQTASPGMIPLNITSGTGIAPVMLMRVD